MSHDTTAAKDLVVAQLRADLAALRARVAELVAALEFWRDLRNESKGLAYYHLNGKVAYWGEFDDPTDTALARAESATPAKHPDTERLDWLEGAPSERLAEVRRILWQQRNTCEATRAAIDAARKQGGAHD